MKSNIIQGCLLAVLLLSIIVILGGCSDDDPVSPENCSIAVHSPNGGQQWAVGDYKLITWNQSGSCGSNVKIELLRNSQVCLTIASSTSNDGSYSWNVSQCDGNETGYTIRITDLTSQASDESNSTFTIESECAITVTSPNGGQQWAPGDSEQITWNQSGSCGSNVKIELLRNSQVCLTIASSTSNDGSYSWNVSQCDGNETGYTIRITDLTSQASDESNSTFTIESECAITVTSPNGGQQWAAGDSEQITWNQSGSCGSNVKIELLRNSQVCLTIASSTSNDGSYSWNVSQCDGNETGYTIRITDLTSQASDESNSAFDISANIPPSPPVVLYPTNGASNQSALELELCWGCTDPDGDNLVFDVYLGDAYPLTLVSGNQSSYCYTTEPLHNSTTYYWYVVAYDGENEPVESGTWHFSAEATTTVSLLPVKDTYINETYPDNNYCNSNGLYLGRGLNHGYELYLQFDYSDIPDGAVISDGSWKIYLYQWQVYPDLESGDNIALFRSEDYWSECSLDWNNRPDPDHTDIALIDAIDEENVWVVIWDPAGNYITDLIRQMISGSLPNRGFRITDGGFDSDTYVTFRSTRWGDPSKHPRMEITYIW
jgi:hypothetical protein